MSKHVGIHRLPPEEGRAKFLTRVRKTATCWWWEGPFNKKTGYGQVYYPPGQNYVHRASYMLFKGPIPDDKVIMHICDQRKCCNPDHLAVGTRQDNMQDRDHKGRHRPPSSHVRLSEALRKEIAAAYQPRVVTQIMLAQQYGISEQTVANIIAELAPEKSGKKAKS